MRFDTVQGLLAPLRRLWDEALGQRHGQRRGGSGRTPPLQPSPAGASGDALCWHRSAPPGSAVLRLTGAGPPGGATAPLLLPFTVHADCHARGD